MNHTVIKDTLSYDRVIVVSDVHGCLEPLERLLERVKVVDRDLVLFVGDLVNKGPDGPGVLRKVRSLPGAMSVRGNHEERLNIGKEITDKEKFLSEELGFLKSLPLSIFVQDRNLLVVHAGINQQRSIEKQKKKEVLNMRTIDMRNSTASDDHEDQFHKLWASIYKGPHFVVFGHNAKRGLQQEPHALGIDTGCVYGRELTAAVFSGHANDGYQLGHEPNGTCALGQALFISED